MLKRSNDFQRLIKLIEQQLAPSGAVITESAMVASAIAGSSPAEVDILVSIPAGPRTLLTAVECRDHKRRQTVEWIRELRGKYEHLHVDRVVAVSSSGFTADAVNHAQHWGIDTLTLDAAQNADWAAVLQHTAEVHLVAVELELLGIHLDTRPHLHPIDYPGDDLSKVLIVVPPPGPVSADNPERVLSLYHIVDRVLGFHRLTELVQTLAADDPNRIARFPITAPPGTGVFPIVGTSRSELRALWLAVRERQRSARIPLGHHMYAGAAIAHGAVSTELAARATFVQQGGPDPCGHLELQLDGEDYTFAIAPAFWDDPPAKASVRLPNGSRRT